MTKIIRRAFIDSVGTLAYIILVVLIIFSFESFIPDEDILITPIAMILLFVTSASVTGFLVFGKPIMLYMDGKKKEAVSLLAYTLVILGLLTIIFFLLLIIPFN